MNSQRSPDDRQPGLVVALLELLPADLRVKLLGLKATLIEQGCVAKRVDRRSGPHFRVRYRVRDPDTGALTHRSLSLGSSESMAEIVRELLFYWQQKPVASSAPTDDHGSAEDGPIKMADFSNEIRDLRATIKAGMPRSRRRTRLLDEFDRMIREDSPRELMNFTLSMGTRMDAMEKPGRPRKLRSW